MFEKERIILFLEQCFFSKGKLQPVHGMRNQFRWSLPTLLFSKIENNRGYQNARAIFWKFCLLVYADDGSFLMTKWLLIMCL